MAIGYSIETVRKIKEADRKKLGVKLGLYCVDNNISVAEIAAKFGVSRTTVYNWFTGSCNPDKKISAKVTKYIDA